MIVIIAEKPSQAKAYADAFETERKNGYYEVMPNGIFPKGAKITWCVGHLLEIPKPEHFESKWAKWNLHTLPIFPSNFEFLVKESVKEQFMIVQDLLKKASLIIIATDIDREGENIAWSVIEYLQLKDKVPIKRLFINTLEPDVVYEGFKNLKNGFDFYNFYQEAKTRQISDWLVGMNLSPLYSLYIQKKGINETFSIGRVQTPTLCLINAREQAIKNFKEETFYENAIKVKHINGIFEAKAEGRYFDKSKVQEIFLNEGIQENKKHMTEIYKVKKTIGKEYSPKLFTLSTLQARANKLYKYSPSKTLDIVQSLYEKKLVTYPRTDIPYITEKEYAYLLENFEKYAALLNLEKPDVFIDQPNSRYVDNKKVAEHFGIIMTKSIPTEAELNKLSTEELNIYNEVIRNTLAMFFQPYKFEKTVITIKPLNTEFKVTGRVELEKGWKVLFDDSNDKKETVLLPLVDEGDPVQIEPFIREGKTTKPKRLTEGDLITLMKNADKNLTDEELEQLASEEKSSFELGTEATRAPIIETLKERGYITVQKNLVYVTKKGELLCQAVEDTLLASPLMTAKWEAFLNKIGKGERQPEQFIEGVKKFIEKQISEVPTQLEKLNEIASMYVQAKEEAEIVGKCPLCKTGKIVILKNFYGCTNRECKQIFSAELLSKKISPTQMKKLLEKGKTDIIKGFKGKNKQFDAHLILEKNENGIYKYKFSFS